MKVLVTGSEGYIGNRFITLKQGKHQICGCDLNPCKSSPVLEYFNFSFEDLEPKQLEGFDAVLHLAAGCCAETGNSLWPWRTNETG